MSLINCKNLRLAVSTAGVLFVLGILLQAPRLLFGADLPVLATTFSGIGLLAIVLSPTLIAATTLLSLLPGAARQLELCRR
ncbi:hypothetical protein [Thiosocius teredinicola]|uniref:hypothetical protein n=1 Tax=Thiosocius teredinicola TaxID=1973002 RepID=UPI000F770BBC